ncbi:MAG: transcriptional repressor [Clostridia bacterium]|nr:transcriptional repressor [Clostridia bacterium]
MQEYKTKQKEILLQCLIENKSVHMTAADISRKLNEQGHSLGLSTVYRQLDKLVAVGLVKKYIIDESSSACYQYVDLSGNCCEHFHLKCNACGRLFHTNCSFMKQIAEHMKESHGFEVDSSKTILYGICGECSRNNTAEENEG